MTPTLEWLNEHWFHILGPALLVLVGAVIGRWLRSLVSEALEHSGKRLWRPAGILLRRLQQPLEQWFVLLGLYAAGSLSILAEPVILSLNRGLLSLAVISIAWYCAGAAIEFLRTYEPGLRRFLTRTKAPQAPTALFVNGIRSLAAVITVFFLLKVWQGPNVIGALSLVAVIVVVALALNDASEAAAAKRPTPQVATEPTRGSRLPKIALSLMAVALCMDIVRRLALAPSEPGLEQNAALLWTVLEAAGVVWALTLLLRRPRTKGRPVFPIIAAVAVVAVLTVLIPTLIGIEPISSYTRSIYQELRTDLAHADWLIGLPEAPSLSPLNVVEEIRPAVVVVKGTTEQGTGMIIDGEGRVLTCWHVVEGCNLPRVLVQNRYYYDCTVDTYDAETDLALLVPDHQISTPDFVTFGRASDVKPGDELWVIGYALGLQGDASVTKGIVSAIRRIDDVVYLQTDAPMNPGNSGGPIVDNRGRVVAVAAWKIADIQIEGMQFGVAIDHATPLLEFSSGGA